MAVCAMGWCVGVNACVYLQKSWTTSCPNAPGVWGKGKNRDPSGELVGGSVCACTITRLGPDRTQARKVLKSVRVKGWVGGWAALALINTGGCSDAPESISFLVKNIESTFNHQNQSGLTFPGPNCLKFCPFGTLRIRVSHCFWPTLTSEPFNRLPVYVRTWCPKNGR